MCSPNRNGANVGQTHRSALRVTNNSPLTPQLLRDSSPKTAAPPLRVGEEYARLDNHCKSNSPKPPALSKTQQTTVQAAEQDKSCLSGAY